MKLPLTGIGFNLKQRWRVRSSACKQMTLISNIKGPYYGQPIVLIPNKLYFACYDEGSLPSNDEHCVYIPVDEYVHYDPFYDDFGPYNLSVLFRFIKALDNLLKSREKRKVVCCASSDERDRVNGCYLMAGFMILIAGYSADKAMALVNAAQPPPFIGFRDASLGPPIYQLPLVDVVKSIEKAVALKWFNYGNFDPATYEHFERVENGDLNWVIPGKLLSFCGPHHKSYIEDEYPYHAPETYFEFFRKTNVTTIVRLNKKLYPAKRFTDAGFEHHDLFFIDGSTPSEDIVSRFIHIVDNAKGGVAVHCKAGLGRTGTLIACWMMKEFRVTAPIAIAWLRICRPGSVIGPQQPFLLEIQSWCWNYKSKKRSQSPKTKTRSSKGNSPTSPRALAHALDHRVPMGERRSLRSSVNHNNNNNNNNNNNSNGVGVAVGGASSSRTNAQKMNNNNSATNDFDEMAVNEFGQSQGDRLLELKAKHQHQNASPAPNTPPGTSSHAHSTASANRTPVRYSSATTPIKQFRVTTKRVPTIMARSSAARNLQNVSASGTSSASSNTPSTSKKAKNIPIYRVTVTSSSTPTVLRSSAVNVKKHATIRSQPYPASTNSLSNHLSKINLLNKYELRPRKTLHSPTRYDPSGGTSFSSSPLAKASRTR